MARLALNVLLFALATVIGYAQSGSVTATARGGFQYIGSEGEAVGSISGEIHLGSRQKAQFMFVLKDVGGATIDGQNEAIVFLETIERSKADGNTIFVAGKGTFQGDSRDVEITLVDSKVKSRFDQVRVRVLRSGRVEFDQTVRLDTNAITISRQK